MLSPETELLAVAAHPQCGTLSLWKASWNFVVEGTDETQWSLALPVAEREIVWLLQHPTFPTHAHMPAFYAWLVSLLKLHVGFIQQTAVNRSRACIDDHWMIPLSAHTKLHDSDSKYRRLDNQSQSMPSSRHNVDNNQNLDTNDKSKVKLKNNQAAHVLLLLNCSMAMSDKWRSPLNTRAT